jgi:hypothetical protein
MKKYVSVFVVAILFLTSLPLFAEQICNFKGDLDFLKHIFSLEMDFKEKSMLKTNVNFEDDKLYLDAKIQNFKFNGHFFSSEISGLGQFVDQEGSKVLKCNLESKYSLMDYKPFNEVFSNFIIGKDSLVISALSWGKSNIIGDVSLLEPREINLYAEIKEADIREFSALIGLSLDDLTISGTVDGFLKIKGTPGALRINGQLKAANGIFNDLPYQEITLRLEGVYPVVNLYDCEIVEEDGTIFAFNGKVNLAQLNNLYSGGHNITFSPLTKSGDFNWRRWTIRRNKERGSFEVENRLKSGRPDSLRLRDESSFDMLGVEQTLKF